MPYNYNAGRYEHKFPTVPNSGKDLYLNHKTSVDIERNLLTFAASRSGKGACQIIPTLLNWQHNALIIDPKGEAAEATAEAREAMGQAVHVLDPFETCNVDERFRARLNLLDEIDPKSPHAFRQINAMADGFVMRHSPESGHWDGGAQEVLAGFLAQVIGKGRKGRKNLIAMRQLLTEPDAEKFGQTVDAMAKNQSCGRLAITGAGKLTKTGSEAGHFLSGAVSNTKWLDDPFMQACLSDSTFKLSELKEKPTTVFLVLPFDALNDYGRFLRLFVRMALYHMMQKMPDGSLKGERCLFILDEFFSLGHISEIQKSVGGLPGYNLHLWPFLQDRNQLIDLYGKTGSGTFQANADFTFLYGINDAETAEFASKEIGLVTEKDLQVRPPSKPKDNMPDGYFQLERWKVERGLKDNSLFGSGIQETEEMRDNKMRHEIDQKNKEAKYADKMDQYNHARSCIGHARLSPQDAMQMTAKSPSRNLSEQAIVLSSGQSYALNLEGYFEDIETLYATERKKMREQEARRERLKRRKERREMPIWKRIFS